jgi:hypothetical protein
MMSAGEDAANQEHVMFSLGPKCDGKCGVQPQTTLHPS